MTRYTLIGLYNGEMHTITTDDFSSNELNQLKEMLDRRYNSSRNKPRVMGAHSNGPLLPSAEQHLKTRLRDMLNPPARQIDERRSEVRALNDRLKYDKATATTTNTSWRIGMPTTSKPLTKRAKDVLLNVKDRRSPGTYLSADGLPAGRGSAKGGAIRALMARLEVGGYLTYRNGWALTEAGLAVASNHALKYRRKRGLPGVPSTRE